MILLMCAKRAGKWGRGLVSARKATLVGSYGEGGGGHCKGAALGKQAGIVWAS